MDSIFDKNGTDKMIARINILHEDSQPLWGTMSVDQMLKHCSLAIKTSQGKLDLKMNYLMKILGKTLKHKIIYNGDFQKGGPTAKELLITRHYVFSKAKSELIRYITVFADQGRDAIPEMNHPFFGDLTYEEWDLLIWKHLDYHLKQFGV